MKCPFCIKVCSKCGELLVAYSGNFNKKKNGKYGLEGQCKKCKKKYREEHKEEMQEYYKQYYQEHKEELAIQRKRYYEENKEVELKKMKEYYEEHKEEISEYNKQYRENNKEQIAIQKKEYYEEHREEILERNRQYIINNPHIKFNSHNKRRQKLENQGRGITKEQWKEMFDFFEWKCAYSGKRLSSKKNRSIDHIDCVDNGGLNEIWNLIPMLKSYNSSKKDKDILEWYKKQEFFSEERLNKIYEWVEYAWNKWGYETEEEIVFNYCDLNDETIERYFEELEEVI